MPETKRIEYNANMHRRSIRLKGYDYSSAGMYFVTICCQDRICRFGNIEKGIMKLNEYGQIAHDEWIKLGVRFPNFESDVFQIMPNHIHGIITLNNTIVGAGFTPAQNDREPQIHGIIMLNNTIVGAGFTPAQNNGQPQGVAPTIGGIVGAYKSLVANGCLEIFKSKNETMGRLWQRNYYEHIIRNEKSYNYITDYIINNPANWENDKLYHQ